MTKTLKRPARSYSIWSGTVRDKYDRLKTVTPLHANLRTDAGDDWQANMMGGIFNRGESGTATSVTATSLTKTGASFPVTNGPTGATTSGYAGHIISAGPNASGTGSTVYGVIVSNTATVITIDRWVDAGTPFAAGTTPNGTATFQVLPGGTPAWFLALTSASFTPAVTDTTLSTELTTNGFTRTQATTFTHTLASATYSIAVTFTASGTQTINNEAIFNASSTTAAGIMAFESAEPNPPTLVSGDTLAQTVTVNY